MAHDLFISYSTQDKAIADRLVHALEAEGVRCWIAPRDVAYGSDWQQSIMDAIAASKGLVLVFTASTNTSSTVRKEVLAAVESNVLVIPFRVEDVRPQGALKFNLIDVHWLDAMSPPLEQHIEALVTRVARLTEDDPPEPKPKPRRRRKAVEPVIDEGDDEDEFEAVEPEADPPPPPPIQPPPVREPEPKPDPPPLPPHPSPHLVPGPVGDPDVEKKQRRQTMLIIGGVLAGGLLLVAILGNLPSPPKPPEPYDSNVSDSNTAADTNTLDVNTVFEPPNVAPPTSAATSDEIAAGIAAAAVETGSPTDVSPLRSSDSKNRYVTIINQTGKDMVGVYASAPSAGWGNDRMGGVGPPSAEGYRFNLSDGTEQCQMDIKAVFADRSFDLVKDVNVCATASHTFSATVGP